MTKKLLIVSLLLPPVLLLSACLGGGTQPAVDTSSKAPEVAKSETSDGKAEATTTETANSTAATTGEVSETQQSNASKTSEVAKSETTAGGEKTCSENPITDPNISGEYNGECQDGLAEGSGVTKGKDRYDGQFHKGMMNGKGTYTWANGDRYDGNFVNDKKHGEGVFYDAKTNKLSVVEFRNNEKIGKATTPEVISRPSVSSTEKGLSSFRDNLRPGMMTMQGLVIEVKTPERIAKVQTEGSVVSSDGRVSFGLVEKWIPFEEIYPLREDF